MVSPAVQPTDINLASGDSTDHKHPPGLRWQHWPWTSTCLQTAAGPQPQTWPRQQHSPPTSTKPQVVAQTSDIYWPQAVTRISNGNPDHGHPHEVRLQYGLEQGSWGTNMASKGSKDHRGLLKRSNPENQIRTRAIAHAQLVSGLRLV